MAKPLGEIARTIGLVATSDNTSFARLVKIAKLDPAVDFRGADLSGVDLGNLDISKFDFANANLQKADLSQTRGFDPNKFSGANLAEAKLPADEPLFAVDSEPYSMSINELAEFDAKSYWESRLKWLLSDRALQVDLVDFIHRAENIREHFSQVEKDAFKRMNLERDQALLAAISARLRDIVPIFVCFPVHPIGTRTKKPRSIEYLSQLPVDERPTLDGKLIRLGRIARGVSIARRRTMGRQLLRRNELAGVIEVPIGLGAGSTLLGRIEAMTGKYPSQKNAARYIRRYISLLMAEIDALPRSFPVISIVELDSLRTSTDLPATEARIRKTYRKQ